MMMAAQLQKELWSQAVAAGKESPTALVTSFISALNDTIDLDATRTNALRSHVPGAVWLLVLAVAACGCAASGYGTGASGARSAFPTSSCRCWWPWPSPSSPTWTGHVAA